MIDACAADAAVAVVAAGNRDTNELMMIGVWGERAPQSFPKREIGVAEIFEY